MADIDALHEPLGSVPLYQVHMTRETLQSLRRVIAQYLPVEQRHWEESGEPLDHVFHDLVAVRWAIRQFDYDEQQERKINEQLNEKTVRLSQG